VIGGVDGVLGGVDGVLGGVDGVSRTYLVDFFDDS
jgi:hypothetical protein